MAALDELLVHIEYIRAKVDEHADELLRVREMVQLQNGRLREVEQDAARLKGALRLLVSGVPVLGGAIGWVLTKLWGST